MKNALSVTLGILLLATAGFAGKDPVAPDPTPTAPAHIGDRAEKVPDIAPLVAALQPAVDAKQCGTRAASNASDDDTDACDDCQLACFAEWRKCRRSCGFDDWYDCHDRCVDELIWCQTTGCADVCDSSAEGRAGK